MTFRIQNVSGLYLMHSGQNRPDTSPIFSLTTNEGDALGWPDQTSAQAFLDGTVSLSSQFTTSDLDAMEIVECE